VVSYRQLRKTTQHKRKGDKKMTTFEMKLKVRHAEARENLSNQLWAWRETEEYKNWQANPTKENLEKAKAKKREMVH
jgi:hypothetical protein